MTMPKAIAAFTQMDQNMDRGMAHRALRVSSLTWTAASKPRKDQSGEICGRSGLRTNKAPSEEDDTKVEASEVIRPAGLARVTQEDKFRRMFWC